MKTKQMTDEEQNEIRKKVESLGLGSHLLIALTADRSRLVTMVETSGDGYFVEQLVLYCKANPVFFTFLFSIVTAALADAGVEIPQAMGRA
ncbi:MAG: hypothetical protein GTO24_08295 [candidate division Zixibacteria bacterium]|nr:hypothetical protein [candidate division Zixibacteria bacterium]